MEFFSDLINQYAHQAHWIIFVAILLAGFNLPISTDLIIIGSAVIAATIVPEQTVPIFLAILFGAYFSAWIAYWLGRLLGPRLAKVPLFSSLLNPLRLEKVKKFYQKHGLLTLIIGRFIPFGVRNCIFMTTGMSKLSFRTFLFRDAIACPLWASISFTLFYLLGQNLELLYSSVKTFNILIFSLFAVTVIAVIWYKKEKRKKTQSE